MSLLSRLFGSKIDDRAPARALWQRVVELARAREWYADCGIADTMQGRFDALVLVLALVMLRMEREHALIAPSSLLSELFIEDMDGQMRQSGVGDLVVGKRMGKLMGAVGGRMVALREVLALEAGPARDGALIEVARRNATLLPQGDPARVAAQLDKLARCLDGLSAEDLLAGRIAP